MLLRSLLMKIRKWLAHDVLDTFATPSGLVHGVRDTDCWAQNVTVVLLRLSNTSDLKIVASIQTKPENAVCLFFNAYSEVHFLRHVH